MNVYSNPSTHCISGLAAGGTLEQFEVGLKMPMEWVWGRTWGGHDGANFAPMINQVRRSIGRP